MMKRFLNRTKKLLACLAAIFLVVCSGCSGKLKLTTDLNRRLLASCGSSTLSLQEFSFMMMDCQNRYNLYYTGLGSSGFWEEETEGRSFSDQVKESELREELSVLLLLNEMARGKKISLSSEEKAICTQAASDYFNGLSEPEKEYCLGTMDTVASLYEKYALAEKVIALLCSDMDEEVSDNDKRVILLQVISCPDLATAEQALKRVEEGESFSEVAREFSTLQIVDYQVTRGMLNPVLEDAAFHMSDGETSQIIRTDEAFYLLRCVNDFDQSLSKAYEKTTLDGIRYAVWSEELMDFAKDHPVAISYGLFGKLTFAETTAMQTTDLYATFERYWNAQ